MCDCDCELPKRVKWEQIKREHAHELAAKIRAHRLEEPDGYTVRPSYKAAWEDGRRSAAMLIEPEGGSDAPG